MIKKLTKHGNSYAIVIDKPIMDLLNMGPGTLVDVVSDGERLMLCPVRDDKVTEKLDAWLDKRDKRYAKTYQRLAGR